MENGECRFIGVYDIDTYEPTGVMFEKVLLGKVRFKGEVMEWWILIWLVFSWFWLMDE